jgi:hypothetical protein
VRREHPNLQSLTCHDLRADNLAEALAQDRAAPDRARAEEAMAESIRLGKEIEFNPELARTHVSYARLLQRWGEDGQARSYLTQAIAMFQAMDMGWDLARAEAILATGPMEPPLPSVLNHSAAKVLH